VQWTPSGVRTTVPYYANNPLWAFEFTYEVILDNPNKLNPLYQSIVPPTDLEILQAFWFQAKGAGNEFVYNDLGALTNQPLAAPDVNGYTEIRRLVGSYPTIPLTGPPPTFNPVYESVQELNGGTLNVFANNVATSNYTVLGANTISPYEGITIHWNATPANPITANFTPYYRCVFSEDTQEYEEFMYQLVQLGSLKIEQVRVAP